MLDTDEILDQLRKDFGKDPEIISKKHLEDCMTAAEDILRASGMITVKKPCQLSEYMGEISECGCGGMTVPLYCVKITLT